jgi:hypothetical protein
MSKGRLPKAPRISSERFCSTCEVFKDRCLIANQINTLFGRNSTWDFATCYKSCNKKFMQDALNERHRRHLSGRTKWTSHIGL